MKIEILTDFHSPEYGPCRVGEIKTVSEADGAAFIRDGRAVEVREKSVIGKG